MEKTKLLVILCLIMLLLSVVNSKQETSAQSMDHFVFLPTVQFNLTPPPTAISYYIEDVNASAMWNKGCNLAYAVRAENVSFVVSALQFGNPQIQGNTYGVNIYGFTFPFHSLQDVEDAAYNFAQGYGYCTFSGTSSPWLILAIGVNNQGSNVITQHGIEWGEMVDEVNNRLDFSTVGYKTVAVAGGDLELGFNEPLPTRNWVNGVLNSPTVVLYHYGTAGGCPSVDVPGTFDGDCATSSQYCSGNVCNWRQSDVWQITVGQGRIRVIPQIYANNGFNAQQWYQMALYGYRTNQLREMDLRGAFTQYVACQQVTDPDCPSLDNTPAEGWLQLANALRQDPQTVRSLPYSTDIQWQNQ